MSPIAVCWADAVGRLGYRPERLARRCVLLVDLVGPCHKGEQQGGERANKHVWGGPLAEQDCAATRDEQTRATENMRRGDGIVD